VKVAFGIPAYRRSVDVGHFETGLALGMTMAQLGKRFELVGLVTVESCSIDYARNEMLHLALKAGADWLLMMDADTFHGHYKGKVLKRNPAMDILYMLEEGTKRDAAVIAAPVAMRNRPGYNVVKKNDAGEDEAIPYEELVGKITQVDRIGTAFMGVNCKWIRACWPDQPWFLTQHFPGPAPRKLGEDYSFCDGVTKRGGTILADGRFEPNHIG